MHSGQLPNGQGDMGRDFVLVRVSENGRLSIPARLCKSLGLEDGGMVVAKVVDGELRVRPAKDVIAGIQARVREELGPIEGVVDRFIAEKHEEAAREEGEIEAAADSLTVSAASEAH